MDLMIRELLELRAKLCTTTEEVERFCDMLDDLESIWAENKREKTREARVCRPLGPPAVPRNVANLLTYETDLDKSLF